MQTSTSANDAMPPGDVRRGLLRQGIVRWSSTSTEARHEGDLGARPLGFESIRGCALGSYGLQMSAAPLRSTARKRGREENAGDGRRSGLVKIVVFDETAAFVGPGTGSMRDSPPEQSRRDRERQRRDQDPRFRPTTPERPGSVARRDPGQGLIRVERCWASREGTRWPSDACQSWRLAVKRGSTRSCPSSGLGRAGSVEARSTYESRWRE